MLNFTVYSINLIYASVCTSLPVEEIVDKMTAKYPVGPTNKWILSEEKFFGEPKDDPLPNPCPCENHPETHTHYLLEY